MARISLDKLRVFSAGWSFLDNEGKPLVGEIEFYDNDDLSRPCEIYDAYGTVLSNPIETTTTGRCIIPVYLENNKIYRVYYYKYTSGGRQLQYSVTIPKNIFVFPEIDPSVEQNVTYISNTSVFDMITGIPWQDGHIYGLLGYNRSGDTEIVYYNCKKRTVNDPQPNGGSVFVAIGEDPEDPDDRYTMTLIPVDSKYFDVKHFGVMPSLVNSVNLGQLANCNDYCQANGLTMYFSPIYDVDNNLYIRQYNFENCNYTFASTVYADYTTSLNFVNSNVTMTFDDCRPRVIADQDSSIVIKGERLYYSSITNGSESRISLQPSRTLVIDAYSDSVISANNCDVIIDVKGINSYNLQNCQIFSDGNIDGSLYHTFNNCTLKYAMFYNNSDAYDFVSRLSLYGNTYDEAWPGAYQLYMKSKDMSISTIDLKNIIFSNIDSRFRLNFYGSKILKNVTLRTTLYYKTAYGADITLENVTCGTGGSVQAESADRNPNSNFVGLTVRNSTISGNIYVRECLFENSTLTGNSFINCLRAGIFTNSIFEKDTLLETGYDSRLYNNIIKSHVDIWPSYSVTTDFGDEWVGEYTSPSYSCEIMNNTFDCAGTLDHGFVYFMRTKSDETVLPEYGTYVSKKVRIANNVVVELPGSGNTTLNPPYSDLGNNVARFVRFDPTRILQYSGAYVYSNNTGDGFGSSIGFYCQVVKKADATISQKPVISFFDPNQTSGNEITLYMYASQFMFCFGEQYSKRMWNAHVTIRSNGNSYRIDCPDDSSYSISHPSESEQLFSQNYTVIEGYLHVQVGRNKFLLSSGTSQFNPILLNIGKTVNVGENYWLNIEIKEDAWLMTHARG